MTPTRCALARSAALTLLLVNLACGSSAESDGGDPLDALDASADSGVVDAGHADAQPSDTGSADSATPDAGVADAGEADAGAIDAGGPLPGFGAISGLCGELDDELTSAQPFVFDNAIDFDMGYTMANFQDLSPGARTILTEGTAGGSSEFSEAFAYEVLHRCEGAELIKTETFVMYDPPSSKKTDILVQIDGLRIGVSVARAVGFPRDDPYTVERSLELLTDKMSDILISSANVLPEDAWTKQILHVIAYGPMHAQSILTAEAMVAPEVRADTVLWVTVTNGDDAFIYDN